MTNLLARIPLFSDLPEAELDQLIAMLKVVELKPRDVLFREGDVGEHFYVVADGELEILRAAGQPEELLLNVIGEGQYLGEMSLIMPGGQRTADVRARTTATLLVMRLAGFRSLVLSIPSGARIRVRRKCQ